MKYLRDIRGLSADGTLRNSSPQSVSNRPRSSRGYFNKLPPQLKHETVFAKCLQEFYRWSFCRWPANGLMASHRYFVKLLPCKATVQMSKANWCELIFRILALTMIHLLQSSVRHLPGWWSTVMGPVCRVKPSAYFFSNISIY
jgi:hypothetical protein